MDELLDTIMKFEFNNDLQTILQNIVVVSGLPRSGTSLMMQILKEIGFSIFTDNKRSPDASNPKGYFEHEAVKHIEKDTSWLIKAKGKAVKIVSHLLFYLPENFQYKIIFMKRNLNEIILSQNKMLALNDPLYKPTNPNLLKKLFEKNLRQVEKWKNNNQNVELLYIDYMDVLNSPENEIKKIMDFLEIDVDPIDVSHIISRDLYHSRHIEP